MQTTLYRYTFENPLIRDWVEKNCEGKVLNLFAGETKLKVDEIRNDIRPEAQAGYHLDALEFVDTWNGEKFNTVILDPPYSERKSMEMYDGKISSSFNAVKNHLCKIISDNAVVMTWGYHSVSMGLKRGFIQEKILLMSHGGAIHDTIAVKERRIPQMSLGL
jgi:hypothetical protein